MSSFISDWMAVLCQVHNMLELNRIRVLLSNDLVQKSLLKVIHEKQLNNFYEIVDNFKKDEVTYGI